MVWSWTIFVEKKLENKENFIEPTAKKYFSCFKWKDKHKVESTILKEISQGFRKKLERYGSTRPFSFQNGRQSLKNSVKTLNSGFDEQKLYEK